MKTHLEHLLDVVRTSFWFVPALFAVAALALAFVLVWVDTTVSTCDSKLLGWLCAVDAEGARQLLVVIGGSMITVAGVVFSITIVALSMASAQFGPKLLRNYMRDQGNQIVLGTFIADFVYCLMILRYVRSGDADPFVPYLAVNFSTVLALVSLGVLIYFFHHVSSTIHADHVVAGIGHELDDAIGEWIADSQAQTNRASGGDAQSWEQIVGSRGITIIPSPTTGYIQSVDHLNLMTSAEQHDVCLRIPLRAGHFVIKGSTLIECTPAADANDEIKEAVENAFIFANQRSPVQDIEYVIDQINQVAARALSPSLNDPYTAMVCADWLSAALARLAAQDFPSSHRCDSDGRLRVISDTLTFDGIVNTAFDEFRQSARASVSVTVRLLQVIAGIMGHTVEEGYRAALVRQAEMIYRGSQDALPEENDRNGVRDRYRRLLGMVSHKQDEMQRQLKEDKQ